MAGRPPTQRGLAEEAKAEIVATGYELVRSDQYELAAYEALDATLGAALVSLADGYIDGLRGDLEACRRVLSEVRRRDLLENRAHRHLVTVARESLSA